MNPGIITYVGLLVAILVLTWGAIEIIRRYGGGIRGGIGIGESISRRKEKINAQTMNTWVPLKPTSLDVGHDPLSAAQETPDEDAEHELHTRAQQNGHFSESKKNL